jgi:hypothetical protein
MSAVGGRVAGYHDPWPFLRGALGLSAYWLQAKGVGISQPNTDTVWLLAPEVEVTARAALTATWALALGLQGRLALNRPSFQVQPETEVYQLPRWGAGAIFRIEWCRR